VVRYALTGAIENDPFRHLRTRPCQFCTTNARSQFRRSWLSAFVSASQRPSQARVWAGALRQRPAVRPCCWPLTSALHVSRGIAARPTSQIAAIVASAFTVAVAPRLYNATKVIVPVVAIWLAWRLRRRPSFAPTRRARALDRCCVSAAPRLSGLRRTGQHRAAHRLSPSPSASDSVAGCCLCRPIAALHPAVAAVRAGV
jgi:hypothetical protein